ncbi:MAG: undecaprenyldiphospho-muramoylpentapeptide beta-N-acetylglucosaminyltransferase [Rhizobiales bacterium]|nr:undecaprenyldiphospho-muramoylpentapeptide beta-N-acetylglucosaminyltransferase [Hyphomicrobiales bacterium]
MAKGAVLLAAGGTGGHLFPAEALAHELVSRGWQVHLATDDRVERFAGNFPASEVHRIPSATLGGRNPLALARAGLTIWRGVRQASGVIQRIGAKAVVGFGGYPTLPPVYAATRRGVPSLIHEQNVVMGRANKALAGRVTAIAGGFLCEQASGHPEKYVFTGNPVRQPVLDALDVAYAAPSRAEPFRLLVFGGSQGAQFFSDAVPAAIGLLPASERLRVRVTQQVRAEDMERVRAAYRTLGVDAELAPFFSDMAQRLAAAHLVVSRAGASTVTELSVLGRPALLVPYPHALDHDQAANAAALAAAGGAEVHPQATLPPEKLAGRLVALMGDPGLLNRMAEAARSTGKPDAARLLADLTEAIASGMSVARFRKEDKR